MNKDTTLVRQHSLPIMRRRQYDILCIIVLMNWENDSFDMVNFITTHKIWVKQKYFLISM